jgi:hypothetical protein
VALKPMSSSVNYRKFIRARDQALEVLLAKTQSMISDTLRGTFHRIVEFIFYTYKKVHHYRVMMHQIEINLDPLIDKAAEEITTDIINLRISTFILSVTGEAEAMSRATGKQMRYVLSKAKIDKIKSERNTIHNKVKYYLDKRKRKIMDAVQLAMIQEEEPADAIERVKRALPPARALKNPPRVLKTVKEADKPKQDQLDFSAGYVDDQEWADMIDDYKAQYVPVHRGPEDELDFPSSEADIRYGWELEKEINHEFVQQVRDGQIDAANENGITDFVWISILDDKTDECCVWRDGLSSEEISLALESEHRDDECDAIVPPAHFNCRCTMAPMYKDLPEKEPSITGEFQDWLNN